MNTDGHLILRFVFGIFFPFQAYRAWKLSTVLRTAVTVGGWQDAIRLDTFPSYHVALTLLGLHTDE